MSINAERNVDQYKLSLNKTFLAHFVGNEAKRQISNRVLQENEARQIFRKTEISYPLIRTPT